MLHHKILLRWSHQLMIIGWEIWWMKQELTVRHAGIPSFNKERIQWIPWRWGWGRRACSPISASTRPQYGTIEIERSALRVKIWRYSCVAGERGQNTYVNFLFESSLDIQVNCFPRLLPYHYYYSPAKFAFLIFLLNFTVAVFRLLEEYLV